MRWLGTAAILMILFGSSSAATTGGLKLDVLGDLGKGARASAAIIAPDGSKVAEVKPGETVQLKPGQYKVVLPIIGGSITKDDVRIESGRTHTVLVQDAAVLAVNVKDRNGTDPGYGVTVTETAPPHRTVATFLSGETLLFAPNEVDVKVDAPPQGYFWRAVTLPPGERKLLTLEAAVPGELLVEPVWSNLSLDRSTRVVVYKGGTQQQVAVSPPGPEHRIKLEAGNYDIYVENHSGHGPAYAVDSGVQLRSGTTVERKVSFGN